MKIGVLGYGHFADIVAVCLASKGHRVLQYDDEPRVLRLGHKLAQDEPGWLELVKLADASRLMPTDVIGNDFQNCDLVWAAYDVPLTDTGSSNDAVVLQRIDKLLRSFVPTDTPVLLSSQWSVGTTRCLQRMLPLRTFAYVQENIRVGHGVSDFLNQSRIVLGIDNIGEQWGCDLFNLLREFTPEVVMMSPTSAEMSKHALNAFLALQITFINEITALASVQGALPEDVSRALMTDARISPHAYLKPGGPFGGGSLQRDVLTLNALALQAGISTPILDAIIPSNTGRWVGYARVVAEKRPQ